jgi:nitronate monooxygenase
MSSLQTPVTEHLGVDLPIICGPMYPCSNPELVAAASQAGGLGVIQPLSMEFVHGYPLPQGIKKIRQSTQKPVGLNVIVERSAKRYLERMERYVDQALEDGIRVFVTSLGNPGWVVERAHAAGGVVYHDVTERRWALKAIESGVDGLIAVNSRAGGHAGARSPRALYAELEDLGLPLVCAGGVGSERDFVEALELGYGAVQMGTRFIVTEECNASQDYKDAIIRANERDIVLTERLTGVPVAVINTPYIEKIGTRAGPLARRMLRGGRSKHWMRMIYSLQSLWKLKKSSYRSFSYRDYLQAGKSAEGVRSEETVAQIMQRFSAAAAAQGAQSSVPTSIGVNAIPSGS